MSVITTKIENTNCKYVKKQFKRDKAPEKGNFIEPLWWNWNENGLRCLLCYEPMEEKGQYSVHYR